jgi:hypothetical protein
MSFREVPQETERDRKRFDEKWIETQDGCHEWMGFSRNRKGYGGFQIGYGVFNAHRVAYVWAYGESNADLHHTCGNRRCVNPEHVEVAAAGQPHHRGPSPNYCARGHEFTEQNTAINSRGERQCRQCLRDASRRHRESNRERVLARRRELRVRVVHDPKSCEWCGEEFTPLRSDRRFCSARCQATANNRKQYAKRRSLTDG